MRANPARYDTHRMDRVLGVSLSEFYACRDYDLSRPRHCDDILKACIGDIQQRRCGTYGAPRIHGELAADCILDTRKRVPRLIPEMGLAGN